MSDERETWLEGNEDGDVVIACLHPGCMQEGHPHRYNPEGMYIGKYPVGYAPSLEDVTRAWHQHLATH